MDEMEFSLKEQIEFLDSEVELKIQVAKAYEEDAADDQMKIAVDRDVALMKAVRQAIAFNYLLEQMAKSDERPWLEETAC